MQWGREDPLPPGLMGDDVGPNTLAVLQSSGSNAPLSSVHNVKARHLDYGATLSPGEGGP